MPSIHTLFKGENVSTSFSSQNSHAAPVITARIYQLFQKYGRIPIEKLRHLLQRESIDCEFHIKPIPDFIDSAIMIGSPQCPQELLTFSQILQNNADSPCFLAIFPGEKLIDEFVKKEIYSFQNQIAGILYAGSASSDIKKIACQIGCLFWDESEYLQAAEKILSQGKNASAVKILIQGNIITAASLARALQERLNDNGYRCKTFSDWLQAYCMGMIFLKVPINPESYIHYFINHYQLDVALICGENVVMEYDLVISCERNIVFLDCDIARKAYCTDVASYEQISNDILQLLI